MVSDTSIWNYYTSIGISLGPPDPLRNKFPERVWAQVARFTRAREHDLLGDQRALGNSKQLHNQMSYRFVNRLK